jgi:hypothetical protein
MGRGGSNTEFLLALAIALDGRRHPPCADAQNGDVV